MSPCGTSAEPQRRHAAVLRAGEVHLIRPRLISWVCCALIIAAPPLSMLLLYFGYSSSSCSLCLLWMRKVPGGARGREAMPEHASVHVCECMNCSAAQAEGGWILLDCFLSERGAETAKSHLSEGAASQGAGNFPSFQSSKERCIQVFHGSHASSES